LSADISFFLLDDSHYIGVRIIKITVFLFPGALAPFAGTEPVPFIKGGRGRLRIKPNCILKVRTQKISRQDDWCSGLFDVRRRLAAKEKRRNQKEAPLKIQISFIVSPFQTREVTRFPKLPYRPFLLFFHNEECREEGSKRWKIYSIG
jgi:hypothetical protein